MGRNVLVLGGAGFIGSYVARAWADAGAEVTVADFRPPGPESRFVLGSSTDFDLVEISVTDAEEVHRLVDAARPTDIVHLAAVVNPVALATDPRQALDVNVRGTINVLEAAHRHGVARVVYLSSIGVLPSVLYEPIDANHPVVTATEGPGSGFYGASKVASEAFCFAYQSGLGVDVRIVRPSAVYGFGMQWPIYVKPIVEGAVRGERVEIDSGGPFPRDYTHVADVASLIVQLGLVETARDRVFYAATGQPLVTAAQVAQIVADLIPGSDITVGDTITPEDEIELRYRGRISIANATEQLGWQPRYRQVADGLAQYVDAYQRFIDSTERPNQ